MLKTRPAVIQPQRIFFNFKVDRNFRRQSFIRNIYSIFTPEPWLCNAKSYKFRFWGGCARLGFFRIPHDFAKHGTFGSCLHLSQMPKQVEWLEANVEVLVEASRPYQWLESMY